MIETMWAALQLTLRDVFATVRVIDLVDLLLVSLFLYGLLYWLRRTARNASRRAVALALALGTLYLVARLSGMFLLEQVLRLVLAILLLALVVLFRRDLGRLLDRLGVWTLFPTSSAPASDTSSLADILTEAAAHLAETKTGALIALKGDEPWEAHIHGGIDLEGVVSQPLLYSLFNPQTPGHDGAVLVEEGRVTKFAVHLPMANSVPEVSRYGGTRHVAALGLSERCDALVIVVSEERGTISLANGQKLTPVTVDELKTRLETFWGRDAQPANDRGTRWRFHLQTALASLGLATLLWLLFAYSPTTIFRTLELPVEVRDVPEGWQVDIRDPITVRVTLTGPEQAFRLLDRESLAVAVELAEPSEGVTSVALNETLLDLPPRLELYDLDPQRVQVEARPLDRVELPVAVTTSGTLPPTLDLVSLKAVPATVKLLVPAASEPPETLSTEPLELSQIEASGSVELQVQLEPDWHLPQDVDPGVTVEVEVRER